MVWYNDRINYQVLHVIMIEKEKTRNGSNLRRKYQSQVLHDKQKNC